MISLEPNKDYQNQKFKDLEATKDSISESGFSRCTFEGGDFSESSFRKCTFENSTFLACNFSMAKFLETRLIDCKFIKCKLIGIDWSLLNSKMGLKLTCEHCDLSYSLFDKIDISESEFIECKMQEVDFVDASLRKVKFTVSDLARSRFNKVDLTESDFRSAKNYIFDPSKNKCKKAKLSYPEALNLLEIFGLEIDENLNHSQALQ